MLNEKWFNVSVPIDFSGFNIPNMPYPFWSSDAITYSFALSAFAKYEKIVNK